MGVFVPRCRTYPLLSVIIRTNKLVVFQGSQHEELLEYLRKSRSEVQADLGVQDGPPNSGTPVAATFSQAKRSTQFPLTVALVSLLQTRGHGNVLVINGKLALEVLSMKQQ